MKKVVVYYKYSVMGHHHGAELAEHRSGCQSLFLNPKVSSHLMSPSVLVIPCLLFQVVGRFCHFEIQLVQWSIQFLQERINKKSFIEQWCFQFLGYLGADVINQCLTKLLIRCVSFIGQWSIQFLWYFVQINQCLRKLLIQCVSFIN